MPIPGPLDLVDAVRDVAAAATTLRRAAGHAVGLVPRIERAVERAEELVDRAGVAVAALEQAATEGTGTMRRFDCVLDGATEAVTRTGEASDRVGRVVGRIGPLVDQTAAVLAGIDIALVRADV